MPSFNISHIRFLWKSTFFGVIPPLPPVTAKLFSQKEVRPPTIGQVKYNFGNWMHVTLHQLQSYSFRLYRMASRQLRRKRRKCWNIRNSSKWMAMYEYVWIYYNFNVLHFCGRGGVYWGVMLTLFPRFFDFVATERQLVKIVFDEITKKWMETPERNFFRS